MIEIEILKSFGTIRLEAADDKALFKAAGFWTEIPDTCPICQTDVYLRQRTAQGKYEYFEIVCKGVEPHVSNLGQFTSGGLYYKNVWEPDRVGRDRGESESEHTTPADETQRQDAPVSPETKARLLAAQGFVTKNKDGYRVSDPAAKKNFTVRKADGRIVCDCPDVAETCAHILAVRYAAAK